MRFLISILALSFLFFSVSAQKVKLVSDIDTLHQDSDPEDLFEYNGKVYFRANDGIHGYELWTVDNAGISKMVADIAAGKESSYPRMIGNFQDKLLFSAEDNIPGHWLYWVYDGLNPPVSADEYYHLSFEGMYFMMFFNGKIYFHKEPHILGMSNLWEFDGKKLTNIHKGFTGNDLRFFSELKGTLYFTAKGKEIWAFNNIDSLYKVTNYDFIFASQLNVINNSLCFFAPDTNVISYGRDQLWKFDGVNPPLRLTNFTYDKYYYGVKENKVLNGKLYFSLEENQNSKGLLVYDGINPVYEAFSDIYFPENLTVFNNKLFFRAYKKLGGDESLWVYDGINPPSEIVSINGSFGRILGVVNGYLYVFLNYTRNDPVNGVICRIDGSGNLAGRIENVTKIPEDNDILYNYCLTTENGLYFSRGELWRFDGIHRPSQFADINKCNRGSEPQKMIVLKDNLYFCAYELFYQEYYKYDGVHPPAIAPGFYGYSWFDKEIFFDKLYYTGTCGRTYCSVYSYDGINSSHGIYTFSDISDLTEYNNQIYFGSSFLNVNVPYTTAKLLVFDKDENVTEAPHTSGVKFMSTPDNLIVFNNRLYFTAQDSMKQNKLWSYHADQGAEIMSDVNVPLNFNVYKNRLYFSDIDINTGRELWAFDGSGSVYQVKDICQGAAGSDPSDFKIFKNKLYFIADDSVHGKELWSVNEANTPSLVMDIVMGSGGSDVKNFIEYRDRLYFSANDSIRGSEIWSVDSINVPALVSDILPGSGSSEPGFFVILDNKLYFSAKDRSHGNELWIYNGSDQPVVAADILPGAGSSNPANLTLFKDKICFSAVDSVAGAELFEYCPLFSDIRIIDTSACRSYTSPSGKYTWYQSGIYSDTIPNRAGYDSVLAIHLSMKTTSGTIKVTACNNYESPSGRIIWSESGMYTDTIPNASGCDSIITINLTINLLNTAVISSGSGLEAAYAGGEYQWVNCLENYLPITGAFDQSFTPLSPGTYAVIMNNQGCIDTSDCYTIVATDLPGNKSQSGMMVYPNPTSGNFTIDLGKTFPESMITISRYDGEVIRIERILNSRIVDLIIDEPPGIYTVIIITENREVNFKVIKQ